MKKSIKTRIYNAQCIGNVEPIEYMIPYPSMRSLIEGQTIKFSNEILMEKLKITNHDFYSYVQQTSNWLDDLGIKPKSRLVLPQLKYPQTEILIYGIWNLGASAVLPSNLSINQIKDKSDSQKLIPSNTNLFSKIKKYSKEYEPKYKPLLSDEAVLTFEKEAGVRLSHYNLLVNASGIQKALNLKSRTRIYCDIKKLSTSWVVFQVILPIYCGCIYDNLKPEVSIGKSGHDYILRNDLQNLNTFSKNDISISIENTAALSIGGKPIHLSSYNIYKNKIIIKGHSVMMGYINNQTNEESFKDSGLTLSF